VGLGAPPVEALRTNKVQALLFWASAQATFENAGLKLRYLRGADWRSFPDFTFSTLQKTIDTDPAMVEAIARGAAKATIFAWANPDCARRLHWARWPNTKPSGVDDATAARYDMNNQKAQLDSMTDAFKMNGGKLVGLATADAYTRIQNFMLEAKLIDKTLPASAFIINTPGFFDKINKFDAAAVRAQAANCPIK
jgi:NitT/TauT family transport system substrate-binding protein